MNSLNIAAKNPIVNLQANRYYDAKVTLGAVDIVFKDENIKIKVKPYIREMNKQIFVDIERIIHSHSANGVSSENIMKLVEELKPLAVKIGIDEY